MAFKNRNFAKKINSKRCVFCGWDIGQRHAAHIIDDGPEKEWNAISLCPNCALVFDDIIRPILYKALKNYGSINLPICWKQSNKISR